MKSDLTPAERKAVPLCTGCLDYFPDALCEVAALSKVGNDQHNPGEPLHWDKSKSTDEADALTRHLLDRGKRDTDGVRHSAKVAWRALALLQREIEAERNVECYPLPPIQKDGLYSGYWYDSVTFVTENDDGWLIDELNAPASYKLGAWSHFQGYRFPTAQAAWDALQEYVKPYSLPTPVIKHGFNGPYEAWPHPSGWFVEPTSAGDVYTGYNAKCTKRLPDSYETPEQAWQALTEYMK